MMEARLASINSDRNEPWFPGNTVRSLPACIGFRHSWR